MNKCKIKKNDSACGNLCEFLKTPSKTEQVIATVQWLMQQSSTQSHSSHCNTNYTTVHRLQTCSQLVVIVDDWRWCGRRKTIVETFNLGYESSLQYYTALFVALRLLRRKLVNPAELCIARLTRHVAHHVPTSQHNPVLALHITFGQSVIST